MDRFSLSTCSLVPLLQGTRGCLRKFIAVHQTKSAVICQKHIQNALPKIPGNKRPSSKAHKTLKIKIIETKTQKQRTTQTLEHGLCQTETNTSRSRCFFCFHPTGTSLPGNPLAHEAFSQFLERKAAMGCSTYTKHPTKKEVF